MKKTNTSNSISGTVLLLTLLSGCGKKETSPGIMVSEGLRADSEKLETYRGLKVKELFVVVFPKDYSIEEWKAIFDSTKVLSANKRKLRAMEGQDDPAVQEARATLIGTNAEILGKLGEKSLFMMSWSLQDETCRISKEKLKITCKPHNPDNPLNGGMPENRDALRFLVPDPVRSDVKTPYLSLPLASKALKEGETGSNFSLELRLKPESESEKEKWLKGDVVVEKGSVFMDPTGGKPVGEFYPYGYSEITLSK